MNLAGLDPSILGPGLLAGGLVVSTHLPLGREVLRRGIIFVDLAVAQVAGLGVLCAHALGLAPDGWPLQVAAATAALGAAALIAALERRWPELQEALIGTLFVIAASLGILVLAGNPHGGEHLQALLSGQILWVTPPQLAVVGALYAGLAAVRVTLGSSWPERGFYPLFAVAITASLQLVGVYLVFASLILPALAVHHRRGWRAWALGYGVGAAGYGLGLALSALADLPSGPAVVCALAACALPPALLARRAVAAGRPGEPLPSPGRIGRT